MEPKGAPKSTKNQPPESLGAAWGLLGALGALLAALGALFAALGASFPFEKCSQIALGS